MENGSRRDLHPFSICHFPFAMNPPLIPIEHFEIFASGLDHPECLAFDRDGILWAGGEAGQVYRIDRDGKPETIANLGSFNRGSPFTPDDSDLIVCNAVQGLVAAGG